MKVLSLGWGVQSFTMAVMVALGDLPPVDAAIHADTTHESELTYKFAQHWTPWLEQHGVHVVTVKNDMPDAIDQYGGVYIPAYTFNGITNGQIRRQCTGSWKIKPMRRWLQSNRDGRPVDMWIGISIDEALRMKPSDVKYITNRWPLIEKRISRNDCKKYLEQHGIEIPSKSACVFCPYHHTAEWRRVKGTPADWREAVEMDEKIRKARPPYDLFVHPSRKPLNEIDFRTLRDLGQMSLWDEECTGLCGI